MTYHSTDEEAGKEQTKSKWVKRIIMIRAEISKIYTRKIIKSSNTEKTSVCGD